MELDLTDPRVREMANRNHTPEEIWLTNVHAPQLMTVRCETCYLDYPCPTRVTLTQDYDL